MTEAAPHWLEPQRSVRVLPGERIVLRGWRGDDLRPFAELSANLTRDGAFSGAAHPCRVRRVRARPDRAAVRRARLRALGARGARVAPFAGYVGLLVHDFEADFTPCVEVGGASPSRTGGTAMQPREHARPSSASTRWASRRSCRSAFPRTDGSVAVMERLGMTYSGEFDHPRFPPGHRLRRHVLYRLDRASAPPRTITA